MNQPGCRIENANVLRFCSCYHFRRWPWFRSPVCQTTLCSYIKQMKKMPDVFTYMNMYVFYMKYYLIYFRDWDPVLIRDSSCSASYPLTLFLFVYWFISFALHCFLFFRLCSFVNVYVGFHSWPRRAMTKTLLVTGV